MKLRMEPEILRLKLYPIETARELSEQRKNFLESLDPERTEDFASFRNIKQEIISQKKSNFKCKITSISSPSSFWIVGKTPFCFLHV